MVFAEYLAIISPMSTDFHKFFHHAVKSTKFPTKYMQFLIYPHLKDISHYLVDFAYQTINACKWKVKFCEIVKGEAVKLSLLSSFCREVGKPRH
jgi:hypothetical protein